MRINLHVDNPDTDCRGEFDPLQKSAWREAIFTAIPIELSCMDPLVLTSAALEYADSRYVDTLSIGLNFCLWGKNLVRREVL